MNRISKSKDEVQMFRTSSGETMVILSKASYDALKKYDEDAEDLAASKRSRTRMKKHGWTPVGIDAVEAMLDDQNPVAALRKDRKMTTEKLANIIGISRAYLSQIENGKRDGTFETMQKIADALHVSLDLLRRKKT